MNLAESFEFVAGINPAWKTARGVWKRPHIYNRDHCLRLLGKTKNVKRINKTDLATMRAELLREGRANGGVNRIMSILNTVLKELCENEIIDKYPKLKQLDEGKGRQEYYTRQNITDMVRVATDEYSNKELADAIWFGVFTGCRQANLLSLEVRDVNFNNDTILLRDTKNGHPRFVPLTDRAIEAISHGDTCNQRVFPMTGNAVQLAWKRLKKRHGIEGVRFHDLRHEAISRFFDMGLTVPEVASISGHRTVSMLFRYAHADIQAVRKRMTNQKLQ